MENDPYPDMTLFMPFSYGGVVDRALPKIKFSGKREIARLLGILIGNIIVSQNINCDLIVPMPLSKERFAERGYNQAYEMSFPVSVITGIPIGEDVLMRKLDTARQSGITDSTMRAVNVSGAFEVNGKWDLTGLRVMLTDDVATTGHTMHEAAMTLIEAGADDVLCCAFSGNRQIKNDEPF
jgi:ComF family protein